MTPAEKAEQLRALHRQGEPLLLVNAWDAATARIVESLGFPAVATTSAGVANAEGFGDGQRIDRRRMLAAVGRVARAVTVPVTADLEGGYGPDIDDATATVRGAIAAGAVGMNFEDGSDESSDVLIEVEVQCERIRAIRRTAGELGVPAFVVNARTDAFRLPGTTEQRLAEAVRRGNAYRAAGADCIFVPFVVDGSVIEALVGAIDAPLNVLAGAQSPPVAELARIGVARISVGSAPSGYALAAFREAAVEVRDRGTYAFAGKRISYDELNALFG